MALLQNSLSFALFGYSSDMSVIGAFIMWTAYALAIGGGIALFIAFVSGLKLKSIGAILAIIIYIPILFLALYFLREERRGTKWRDFGNFTRVTREAVMEYYSLHPELFKKTGNDEELDIIGFADWLPTFLKERKSNWPEVIRQFRYKDHRLITPEGQEVRYAMDFNNDMYVIALGQKIQTAEKGSIVAATYKTAIGIQFRPSDPIFCEPLY